MTSTPQLTPAASLPTGSAPEPPAPGRGRWARVALATAVIGGPLGFFVGGMLSSSVHDPGAEAIAKNAAANPAVNTVHVLAFVVASYLLPVSAVALARLAYARRPRLAVAAGVVAVLGWLPFSGLTALEDLGAQMGGMPGGTAFGPLLDRFSNDLVMNGFLVVYILGHLIGYVLLGIVLGKARAVPRWAAAFLVASTPLTLAVFFLPGRPMVLGVIALALVVVGSVPAAWATLRGGTPVSGTR